MSLFTDLSPRDGSSTVIEAFNRIRETLAQTSQTGPFSLCEMRADESDYLWLCAWAGEVSCGTMSIALGMSAALVLFLAAEAARREAQEGLLWPVMRGRFRSDVQERYFDENGHPSSTLKGRIRRAIKELRLRQVFDQQSASHIIARCIYNSASPTRACWQACHTGSLGNI